MTLPKGDDTPGKRVVNSREDLLELRYAIGETQLGLVLTAVSGLGIVAILLGDSRSSLTSELGSTFPNALLLEDEAGLMDTLAKVAGLIENPASGLDLPLDLRGSEIEHAVWENLAKVPVGETRTYGAIAKELPVKATALDVGAACASNVVAVAIPCHRVIKADGKISGYRWGVGRKRRLLQAEGSL